MDKSDKRLARSEAISYQALLDRESRPAPAALRASTETYLGSQPLSVDRYLSREVHELEKRKLWPRVWQAVCRETEIAKRGDFYVHDIASCSIFVVRTEQGTYYLPRIVGEAKALELFYSAQPISAAEALDIGMVNQVFPDGEFMERSMAFAQSISRRAPLAMTLVKRAVKQSLSMDLNTHLDMVSSHMLITRPSEDHAEAIKAYEEGREPEFKGK